MLATTITGLVLLIAAPPAGTSAMTSAGAALPPPAAPPAHRAQREGQRPAAGQERPAARPAGEPWPEELPFDAPPIPAYRIPTVADCEWMIQDGKAKSTRGLPEITGSPNLLGKIYAAHVKARLPLPCTVGVWDDGGIGVVAGGWNVNSDRTIVGRKPDGSFADVELEVVGLDQQCEVLVAWDQKWGFAKYIGLYNIGIRGGADSFIIRANAGIGKLIIDGCWWLPYKGFKGRQTHTSGMHIDQWETLVWRNHRFRGELPQSPGTKLREHSAYLKSCVGGASGGTWIVGNDLRGGNRTGFQIRPQKGQNTFPSGPVVIAYNRADGYGFNHGRGRESADGGSCLTVWSAPNDAVYVFGNEIKNARYGCLTVSGQSQDRNFCNENGYPVHAVHLYDNTFENKGGDRAAASISSTEEVTFWGGNTFRGAVGDLVIDAPWAMNRTRLENGTVRVAGREVLEELLELDVRTYDPENAEALVPLRKKVLESWLAEDE